MSTPAISGTTRDVLAAFGVESPEQLLDRLADRVIARLGGLVHQSEDPDEMLTVREAAAIRKVSVQAIYKALVEGSLKCERHGRTKRAIRIRRGSLVSGK